MCLKNGCTLVKNESMPFCQKALISSPFTLLIVSLILNRTDLQIWPRLGHSGSISTIYTNVPDLEMKIPGKIAK